MLPSGRWSPPVSNTSAFAWWGAESAATRARPLPLLVQCQSGASLRGDGLRAKLGPPSGVHASMPRHGRMVACGALSLSVVLVLAAPSSAPTAGLPNLLPVRVEHGFNAYAGTNVSAIVSNNGSAR